MKVYGGRADDRHEWALLDADPTDPPWMHDRLVIATPLGHPAGGSEAIGCMQWTPRVSSEPSGWPMAGLPKLGLGWQASAHRWTGTTCCGSRVASFDCSEWSSEKDASMGAIELGGRLRLAAD